MLVARGAEVCQLWIVPQEFTYQLYIAERGREIDVRLDVLKQEFGKLPPVVAMKPIVVAIECDVDGLESHLVSRIRVGPVVKQQLGHVDVEILCGQMQWRHSDFDIHRNMAGP